MFTEKPGELWATYFTEGKIQTCVPAASSGPAPEGSSAGKSSKARNRYRRILFSSKGRVCRRYPYL
jgi:hypothetical protein